MSFLMNLVEINFKRESMKILSLFDGISCGRIALDRARICVDVYYASEIDKYAVSIAQKNYPGTIQAGDVTQINYSKIGSVDILLGGSPCTSWSIAKRDRETTSDGIGFELFMQYVRGLNETNPKYFVYENNASIHIDIQNAISEKLGVKPILINSALVSAQQRKRLYWTNIPGVTQPEDKEIVLKDVLESGITEKTKSYCIDASYYKGGNLKQHIEKCRRTQIFQPIRIGEIGNGGQGQRIYSVNGKSINLTANGGGQGAKTGLYRIDLPDGNYAIRKLSPIECERLQTVPDNYTQGVSDAQRYKMLGNGWTVDVVTHILKNIIYGGKYERY